MRVAFAGTPAFAATALEAIFAAGHAVPLVFTQPDRPGGRRGLKLTPSAVAETSERLGLATLKPATLREGPAEQALRDARADVMVVAAYGLLVPAHILTVPLRGCINIHASLLPRWRGAAPIQRALLAGDESTGISIMQMDTGLDTGPVLLAQSLRIGASDTAGTLTQTLARLGARLVVEALASLDRLKPCAQDAKTATYAPKVTKAEAVIDWTQPSDAIERRVRAFSPAPGAEARYRGELLKIREAKSIPGSGAPAEVISCDSHGFVVGCGSGALHVKQVQRAGGKAMAAADFARGVRLGPGMVFESIRPGASAPSLIS